MKSLVKRIVLPVSLIIILSGLIYGNIRYTVSDGDTLYSLSRRYNTTVESIMQLNPGLTPQTLITGHTIVIPSSGSSSQPARPAQASQPVQNTRTHTVQAGETLWSLYRLYNVPVSDIARANGISAETRLHIGQQVIIPNASGPNIAPAQSNGLSLAWPLEGVVETAFNSTDNELLSGIIISSTTDNCITASAPGEVAYVGDLRGYGTTVIVYHDNGYYTVYACRTGILQVQQNTRVSTGTPLVLATPEGNMARCYFQLFNANTDESLDPSPYLR